MIFDALRWFSSISTHLATLIFYLNRFFRYFHALTLLFKPGMFMHQTQKEWPIDEKDLWYRKFERFQYGRHGRPKMSSNLRAQTRCVRSMAFDTYDILSMEWRLWWNGEMDFLFEVFYFHLMEFILNVFRCALPTRIHRRNTLYFGKRNLGWLVILALIDGQKQTRFTKEIPRAVDNNNSNNRLHKKNPIETTSIRLYFPSILFSLSQLLFLSLNMQHTRGLR